MRNFSFKAVAFLSGMTLVALSCSKKKDEVAGPPVQVPTANLMIAHKIPDAGGVDVYVDDRKMNVAAITFNGNSGELRVPAGQRNIKITAAGTTTALATFTMNLAEKKFYSAFACNRASNVQTFQMEDSTSRITSGKAMVRFVHLSPDAPNVDVVSGSNTLVSNVGFRSATRYVTLDAAITGTTYNLGVRATGTTTDVVTHTAILFPGRIYTVIARGMVTPPSGNSNRLGATVIWRR